MKEFTLAQCRAAGVPFFFKQWGEWAPYEDWPITHDHTKLRYMHHEGCNYNMIRVGKKRAGRLLDGREWNEFPASAGRPEAR